MALQNLAEAMRLERIAFKTYAGDAWLTDGEEYMTQTANARQSFEKSLRDFVEFLSNA